MIRARSLNDVVDLYDAFLIDQFGVLLDGGGAYASTPQALETLAARGKKILLLSNSGKRSAPNIARLTRFGFLRSTYLDVLSSGEVAHLEIERRLGDDIPAHAKVWVETADEAANPLDGLELRRVERPEQADLVWITGARPRERSLIEYQELLMPAAARGVPAFCSNPDMTMLTATGKAFGAGAVAKAYEGFGGKVEWFGKPYPAIYAEALRRLGRIEPSRVLAFGDSPAHDVLGGARAGVATALVRTGIHESDREADVLARCEAVGIMPDVLMPRFAF